MTRQFTATCLLILSLLWEVPVAAPADRALELPVLAAISQNHLGVFEILLMWWDKKPEPNPVRLQWPLAGVKLDSTHLGSMAQAFAYASERTASIQHSGPSLYKESPINRPAAKGQAPSPPRGKATARYWFHADRFMTRDGT